MGGDRQLRAAAAAFARADDVAFAVDVGVAQAHLAQALHVVRGARLLLEGRRGDLGEGLLLLERARVVGSDVGERLDNGRCREDGVERLVDVLRERSRGEANAAQGGDPPGNGFHFAREHSAGGEGS